MRLVHKYGGSSVATTEKIMAIARRVAQLRQQGTDMVVVCSAMGKTTNGLIALAKEVNPAPSKREMDALLSTGEVQTVSLMAMALQNLGVDAISMTGFQSGFITNDVHSKAFIKEINTQKLEQYLAEGKVVVAAGFQGITEDGHITTLGRGGSDTTAVAIAAKLGCPCEIYTDVDAVYTVDPRIYPQARALKTISYEEMMEMASLGAGVLETRSVELAKKYGVSLYLGRTLETEKKGTTVMSQQAFFEDMPVTGISIKEHCAIVTFPSMEHNASSAAAIFGLIAKANINLDMINQNILEGKLAFSFSCSDEQALELEQLQKETQPEPIPALQIRRDLTQLSLVGVGMATHTGVAVRVFQTLARCQIPYYQITTSEISISFTIDKENKDKAVQALAKEFSL